MPGGKRGRDQETQREREKAKPHSWKPHAVTETTPPLPGAAEITAIPVLVALAGTHGWKICSVMPSPLASGAVHCVKWSVPEMVPVTVLSAVAAAVALARIESPHT